MGLDVKQFRQVMVLPQGKFRELLTANSKEREQIFGQLFQTQLYSQIERALFERAAGIRKEKEEFDQQIKGTLSVVGLESEEQLQTELTELAPVLTHAQSQLKAEQQQWDETKAHYQAALELEQQFIRKQQLVVEIATHQEHATHIEMLRQQRQQAQKAARLTAVHQQWHQAQKTYCKLSLRLSSSRLCCNRRKLSSNKLNRSVSKPV